MHISFTLSSVWIIGMGGPSEEGRLAIGLHSSAGVRGESVRSDVDWLTRVTLLSTTCQSYQPDTVLRLVVMVILLLVEHVKPNGL